MILANKLTHPDDNICMEGLEELRSLNVPSELYRAIMYKAGYFRRVCNNPKLRRTKAYINRNVVYKELEALINQAKETV